MEEEEKVERILKIERALKNIQGVRNTIHQKIDSVRVQINPRR